MAAPSKVWINGDEAEHISATHRGFMYADGVFETLAVYSGRPLLLGRHMARLQKGIQALSLQACVHTLEEEIRRVSRCVPAGARAALKLVVARASQAGRGYRPTPGPKEAADVVLTLSAWQAPTEPLKLMLCNTILGSKPALAGLKTLNALEYVLASMELPDAWHEGVLCDTRGYIIEGTKSNIFWVDDRGVMVTPELGYCGIEGVVRQELIARATARGIAVEETRAMAGSLLKAREIFLTNSLFGVLGVNEFQGRVFTQLPTVDYLKTLMSGVIFEAS